MTELEQKLITLLEKSSSSHERLQEQQEKSLIGYQKLASAYNANRKETELLRAHCEALSNSVQTLNDQLQRLMTELPR